jgi:ABC-2 type transport system permease protein
MKRALRLVGAFLRRDLIVDFSYRGSFVFTVAGAVFSLWSLYFLGRTFGTGSPMLQVAGGDYFRFALVGVSLAVPLRAGMGGVSRRVRELQHFGGLETLVSAPVPPFGSILLVALYPLLNSVARGKRAPKATMPIARRMTPRADPVSALAALALGVAAYLGFGILSASMVIWLKRGDPVAWSVDALTFLVSGILYPVEVLPRALHGVAALVPATHALRALRGSLLQGASVQALSRELLSLAAFSAVLLPFSALVLRLALRKAARDGSLGQA